jgi:hypothetical protein
MAASAVLVGRSSDVIPGIIVLVGCCWAIHAGTTRYLRALREDALRIAESRKHDEAAKARAARAEVEWREEQEFQRWLSRRGYMYTHREQREGFEKEKAFQSLVRERAGKPGQAAPLDSSQAPRRTTQYKEFRPKALIQCSQCGTMHAPPTCRD